jgi:ribose transport system substrate-binding protein
MPRWTARSTAALSVIVAVAGLAACGSSSSAGTQSGSGSPGSGSPGSGSASYLAPYKAALTKAEAPVSWNGPTKSAKAPPGILVGAVNCSYSVEGCKSGGQAFVAVAKELGWRTKLIIVDNPSGYEQAMQTLLNEHVKAIYLGGVVEQLVSNGIKEAAARHIPVVSAGSNYQIGGPGQVNADVHGNVNEEGDLMADAAMVDHQGKVHAVLLQDAEFAEPVAVLQAVRQQFSSCAKCSVSYASPINFTATVIGTQLPGEVVTAVQRDPAINSVMLGFDPPATFVVPALDAAGDRAKVTMYTQLGDSAPLALVQQGNVLKYDVAGSVQWAVWGDFDEIIRYLDHQPLVAENLPLQIFTSANPTAVTNLGADDFAATFAGYEQKYKALWGVQ